MTWATGKPGVEDFLLSIQSDTEAYFGTAGQSSGASRGGQWISAVATTPRRLRLCGKSNAALREAEFGNAAQASRCGSAALALAPGRDVQMLGGAGPRACRRDSAGAGRLVDDPGKRDFPLVRSCKLYWLPTLRRPSELNRAMPPRRLSCWRPRPLRVGRRPPFNCGTMYPIYIRGQAYLAAHNGSAAAAEFQKMHRPPRYRLNFPLGALAHLGLAPCLRPLWATPPKHAPPTRTSSPSGKTPTPTSPS